MNVITAIIWKLLDTEPDLTLVPDVADEDMGFPQVVYESPEGEPDAIYSGSPTLESADVVMACIGRTKKESSDVANTVKALHDEAGTWDGIEVQGIFVTNISTDMQQLDEETKYYITEITFKVWYVPALQNES